MQFRFNSQSLTIAGTGLFAIIDGTKEEWLVRHPLPRFSNLSVVEPSGKDQQIALEK